MELIKTIETALSQSRRERQHFLTFLLAMALEEARGLFNPPPHNDNHRDEH